MSWTAIIEQKKERKPIQLDLQQILIKEEHKEEVDE